MWKAHIKNFKYVLILDSVIKSYGFIPWKESKQLFISKDVLCSIVYVIENLDSPIKS